VLHIYIYIYDISHLRVNTANIQPQRCTFSTGMTPYTLHGTDRDTYVCLIGVQEVPLYDYDIRDIIFITGRN